MRRVPSLVAPVRGSRRHAAQPLEDARESCTRRQSAANRVRNLPACWPLVDRAAPRRTTRAIHSDCLTRIRWKRYIQMRSRVLAQSRPSVPHPGLQNTRVRFRLSTFAPSGAGLHAIGRLSIPQRRHAGVQESPAEIQLVGLQDRPLPPTASREQFCKGFTDRKRCANGAIIGRKSIHPAKLILVNQMRKVKSRARARRTRGTAVQVRIICILLLCYFPNARYKYGCNCTLTALCVT